MCWQDASDEIRAIMGMIAQAPEFSNSLIAFQKWEETPRPMGLLSDHSIVLAFKETHQESAVGQIISAFNRVFIEKSAVPYKLILPSMIGAFCNRIINRYALTFTQAKMAALEDDNVELFAAADFLRPRAENAQHHS